MKKARYYFIKGRPKPHKISYYDSEGRHVAKFFEEKGDALLFQTETSKNLGTIPNELQFDISERIFFAQVKAICSENEVALSDAIRCLQDNLPSIKIKGVTWDEAVEGYKRDLIKRNTRQDTFDGYINKLSLYKKREHPENIARITQEDAERYFSYGFIARTSKARFKGVFQFLQK